jgi:hypothetical protein
MKLLFRQQTAFQAVDQGKYLGIGHIFFSNSAPKKNARRANSRRA